MAWLGRSCGVDVQRTSMPIRGGAAPGELVVDPPHVHVALVWTHGFEGRVCLQNGSHGLENWRRLGTDLVPGLAGEFGRATRHRVAPGRLWGSGGRRRCDA